MRLRWSVFPLVALGVFLVYRFAVGYPWPLAVLLGAAIGALAYSILSAWERVASLYRGPSAAELPPGEGDQTQDQEQVAPAAQDVPGHQQEQPGGEQPAGQKEP